MKPKNVLLKIQMRRWPYTRKWAIFYEPSWMNPIARQEFMRRAMRATVGNQALIALAGSADVDLVTADIAGSVVGTTLEALDLLPGPIQGLHSGHQRGAAVDSVWGRVSQWEQRGQVCTSARGRSVGLPQSAHGRPATVDVRP